MEKAKKGEDFLKAPLEESDRCKGLKNRMCCCKPSLPHYEKDKFKLICKDEAKNKPVFDLRQF